MLLDRVARGQAAVGRDRAVPMVVGGPPRLPSALNLCFVPSVPNLCSCS
jgi:hypothetical protein